jgi:regulator of protease activity HflC (stomatin/prohibitin superfamily)
LAINLFSYLGVVLLFIAVGVTKVPLFALLAVFLLIGSVLVSCGFFTLQPNEAAVLILFGSYKGTVRDSGFF